MTSLDTIKLQAAREANRDNEALCVANLNMDGAPLYVIRALEAFDREPFRVVWIAYPSTIDQGG